MMGRRCLFLLSPAGCPCPLHNCTPARLQCLSLGRPMQCCRGRSAALAPARKRRRRPGALPATPRQGNPQPSSRTSSRSPRQGRTSMFTPLRRRQPQWPGQGLRVLRTQGDRHPWGRACKASRELHSRRAPGPHPPSSAQVAKGRRTRSCSCRRRAPGACLRRAASPRAQVQETPQQRQARQRAGVTARLQQQRRRRRRQEGLRRWRKRRTCVCPLPQRRRPTPQPLPALEAVQEAQPVSLQARRPRARPRRLCSRLHQRRSRLRLRPPHVWRHRRRQARRSRLQGCARRAAAGSRGTGGRRRRWHCRRWRRRGAPPAFPVWGHPRR